MYSEKTKFYTHPELGVQTVALKNGQVYFIPKDLQAVLAINVMTRWSAASARGSRC